MNRIFMKNIALLLLMLGLLTGCSWLDVHPRQEVSEEDIFSTEDGFKQALTGVYIQLADPALYGKNTTFYVNDYLARMWTPGSRVSNDLTDKYLPEWDLGKSEVKDILETVFRAYYTAVAHLNELLYHLDRATCDFSHRNDQLIRGEAVGLRAFLHLDLLRLFGPIPGTGVMNQKAIPYVEEIGTDPGNFLSLTYIELIAKIIRDLDEAERCLQEVDPLVFNSNTLLNNPERKRDDWPEEYKTQDEWQNYRQLRFNYYAVLGTKARLYHWTGEKEKAVQMAKTVIEAMNNDGTTKFRLANENDYLSPLDYHPGLLMLSEHLFALNNPDHQQVIQTYFSSSVPRLSLTEAWINSCYENNASDIRNQQNRYWQKRSYVGGVYNYFQKYGGNSNFVTFNIIPVLRLSELYFILMEDLEIGEIGPYVEHYLLNRNLPAVWKESLTSETAVLSRLEKEYRKEFIGEGQLFFFYKKHRYKQYNWPTSFSLPPEYEDYKLPMPDNQSIFE